VTARIIACALAPLILLGATPSPAPEVPGWPAGDHVAALAGTWACRTVATRVQSSPNPELSGLALRQTRRSKFRTAIIDCKPRAADYIFGVSFQ
jgi:hypothetical protein